MSKAETKPIPEGYKANPSGHLVPLNLIAPIDIARDDLVREIVTGARYLSAGIGQFKAKTFGDIAAFVEMSAEQYGAQIGGKKGNVTLTSYDGRYKVQRAIADHISFDERLQAAKALVDECIIDWSQGSRDEIKVLVQSAFDTDKEGKINTSRVLGLRHLDITDERWGQAMQAIADAVTVIGSNTYLRVYERVGDTDQYQPIPLDVARG
jgi:hypothetical protein